MIPHHCPDSVLLKRWSEIGVVAGSNNISLYVAGCGCVAKKYE